MIGLMGLTRACYLGLYGILIGLTKSTGHPSRALIARTLEKWTPNN